jgi:hypothetical protein
MGSIIKKKIKGKNYYYYAESKRINGNPNLEKDQMQGIVINREKTTAKLLEIQQKLLRRAQGDVVKGKKPTHDSIVKAVESILKTEYQKIRIRMFTCVLVYRLCCLLVKELSEKGIQANIDQLIDEMSKIKRVITFFGGFERLERIKSFTRCSEIAQTIELTYNLKEKYI